ncbi:hypothetical protein CkaCkLH20_13263 [Colletotrichum karsti]|uniref:Uncharacterized protein n=1 Tax=Colletotrichum karsti TaxID=1095194 RepID=A0A9P6HV07_9PEZI|nr:uncharacterized protein CkaCkLH20_13263 [Colletotrichum karsti]KAF9869261.1 hypothetical protein CkaCkLH20_13263 [Colletotrichum karsti]
MAAPKTYFESTTSASAYNNRKNKGTIASLQGESTSNWGTEQLEACRVIVVESQARVLPSLKTALNNNKSELDLSKFASQLKELCEDHAWSTCNREFPTEMAQRKASARENESQRNRLKLEKNGVENESPRTKPLESEKNSASANETASRKPFQLCKGPLTRATDAPEPLLEHHRMWDDDDDGRFAQVWAAMDRLQAFPTEEYMAYNTGDDKEEYTADDTEEDAKEYVGDGMGDDTGDEVNGENILEAMAEMNASRHQGGSLAQEGHDGPGYQDDSFRMPQTPRQPARSSSRKRKRPSPRLHATRSTTGHAATRTIPNTAPSGTMQVENSSPQPEPPSSQTDVFVPDHGPSAMVAYFPEDLTVLFISAFIRHTLPWLPPQAKPTPNPVVVFDDAPASYSVALGDVSFKSRDDGGLSAYYNRQRVGRVALLEAKRVADRPVEGKLPMSDARLGQLVGEALAVRLQAKGVWIGHPDRIIIISAARLFARFIEISITNDYLTELRAHTTDETALFEKFMDISSTCWLDLNDASDRRSMVQNLAGLTFLTRDTLDPLALP